MVETINFLSLTKTEKIIMKAHCVLKNVCVVEKHSVKTSCLQHAINGKMRCIEIDGFCFIVPNVRLECQRQESNMSEKTKCPT